ncbi:MAG: hypothetical protein K0R65_2473 [Crocinitomicaceae bacterium]|jgi:hypothetical protein|nr:hypothetical protein [Crocinitomicaceae bacterium]
MKTVILALSLVLSAALSAQEAETPGKCYNRSTLGLLCGNQSSVTFNVINGYRFSPNFGAGVGIGTEFYLGDQHFSCFGDVFYQLNKSSSKPFAALNFGISEPRQQNSFNKGGVFAGASIGISHFTGKHFGLTTSVGYRISMLDFRSSWWDDYITRGYFKQLELRFGFSIL